MQRENFDVHFLAFANDDEVEERRIRLRIVRTGAARHDQRIAVRAIGSVQRNARQIQKLKDVGCRQLVRQGDSHRVELRKRRARLERKCRQPLCAHDVRKLRRRQKSALCRHAFLSVHHIAEDAHSLVRLTKLVRVGIRHAEAIVGIRLIGSTPFMVDIARRTLSARNQPLQARP